MKVLAPISTEWLWNAPLTDSGNHETPISSKPPLQPQHDWIIRIQKSPSPAAVTRARLEAGREPSSGSTETFIFRANDARGVYRSGKGDLPRKGAGQDDGAEG